VRLAGPKLGGAASGVTIAAAAVHLVAHYDATVDRYLVVTPQHSVRDSPPADSVHAWGSG
jgi:hypothetical protein